MRNDVGCRGAVARAGFRVFLGIAVVVLLSGVESWAQVLVAHRGASHDAPENTLAAFRLAWEQGADAIEGDFHLTKDGQIVCIHDADLKRTGGRPGKVSQMTFAELQEVEVGAWKGSQFRGEKIPTLDEVLAVVPEGKQLFLEVKCSTEIMPALKRSLGQTSLRPEQVVIISFDAAVIQACRRSMPHLKAHWLTSYKEKGGNRWEPSASEVMEILGETGASGLDTKADPDRVTPALVQRLRDEDLEFHCWTVDTPALARHFRGLGVDSITTNRPGWLREQLRE